MIMRHTRAVAFHQDTLYVQRKGELIPLDMRNQNRELPPIGEIPGSWLQRVRLGTRLLRLGVHALCAGENGELVFVAKRNICRYSPANKRVENVFSIPRGTRPLFLGCSGKNTLYFGEYFANPDRQAVHIYCSKNHGQDFDIVFTFSPGTIRHIHGIFCDPYDQTFWVTTGDTNQESGIWVTYDRFNTLQRVIGGSQQIRAVQLLFTEKYVYFGSDTPLEKNHLYRLHKKTREVETLQPVESSVFWGCKVGTALFFSTAVEPSPVNTCQDACVWGSLDGERWKCLLRYRKDRWPKKFFQYGQILFPSGENNTEFLWFTPFATEHDRTLQCMKVTDLF